MWRPIGKHFCFNLSFYQQYIHSHSCPFNRQRNRNKSEFKTENKIREEEKKTIRRKIPITKSSLL